MKENNEILTENLIDFLNLNKIKSKRLLPTATEILLDDEDPIVTEFEFGLIVSKMVYKVDLFDLPFLFKIVNELSSLYNNLILTIQPYENRLYLLVKKIDSLSYTLKENNKDFKNYLISVFTYTKIMNSLLYFCKRNSSILDKETNDILKRRLVESINKYEYENIIQIRDKFKDLTSIEKEEKIDTDLLLLSPADLQSKLDFALDKKNYDLVHQITKILYKNKN